ncbi:MAG TPA: C45 family peptidase, partial [Anaerolineae bacterium]|nr:C45 family peptidase [Anaerolineae bacterium]
LGPIDHAALHAAAAPWLDALPDRYRQEIEGIAQGAGLSAARIAEWHLAESFARPGCTTIACRVGPHAWIARNNDLWSPDLWGYVTVREIDGRIPTISFGLEGEPFTATGINHSRLWLHYHYLPVPQSSPEGNSERLRPLPDYLLLTEALETCHSIADVEALFTRTPHQGGMILFAVDGKTDEVAVWECGPTTCRRRPFPSAAHWIAATNHSCIDLPDDDDEFTTGSLKRLARVKELAAVHCHDAASLPANLPAGLIAILSDPAIEGRDPDRGTVYANVACPSTLTLWYTFGGYPAASAGRWAPVPWPWAS